MLQCHDKSKAKESDVSYQELNGRQGLSVAYLPFHNFISRAPETGNNSHR
jgi:hypothetical protein